MTKSAHIITLRADYNSQQLAKIYAKEIVILSALSIILDRGT